MLIKKSKRTIYFHGQKIENEARIVHVRRWMSLFWGKVLKKTWGVECWDSLDNIRKCKKRFSEQLKKVSSQCSTVVYRNHSTLYIKNWSVTIASSTDPTGATLFFQNIPFTNFLFCFTLLQSHIKQDLTQTEALSGEIRKLHTELVNGSVELCTDPQHCVIVFARQRIIYSVIMPDKLWRGIACEVSQNE